MHRSEYMEADFSGEDWRATMRRLHRAYYGQYVTPEITNMVVRHFGRDALVASKDEHFNDLALRRWDRLLPALQRVGGLLAALRANGDGGITACAGVCILKEAASQVRDGVA